MDVFVIHSGNDKDIVEKCLAELKKAVHSFNPLLMPSGKTSDNNSTSKTESDLTHEFERIKNIKPPKDNNYIKENNSTHSEHNNSSRKNKKKFEIPLWKIDAKQKIKKAQMVVFFIGETSYQSDNIDWEIRKAIKYNKPIYTILLGENYHPNYTLIKTDSYSGVKSHYNTWRSYDQLLEQIRNFEDGDYKVFNQEIKDIDKSILLEQYKIFLQTSEDLVSRRQNVNNFYISINSALMAAFGIVWALDIIPIYKFFTGLLLSLVGIILSVSWIKLLTSYGDLNSSKMKIISYIEKQLPASLYDAEWAALSDKLNKRKYVSFTNSEKRVPKLYIVVYICVSICGAVFLFC
jgi:hypothetical protein